MQNSALDLRAKEIDWYTRNGRYPSRITKDANENSYVIGDFSWNRNRADNLKEFIEPEMSVDINLGR